MRRYLLVTAILVVIALLAGAFLGPRIFPSSIATAEDRWFSAARSDYKMTIDHECFCPWAPTFTVTVRSNQPIRLVQAHGRSLSLRAARGLGTPLTVEDLFTLAHSLIALYGSGMSTSPMTHSGAIRSRSRPVETRTPSTTRSRSPSHRSTREGSVSVAGASIDRWATRARSCTRTPTPSTRRSSSATTRRCAAAP